MSPPQSKEPFIPSQFRENAPRRKLAPAPQSIYNCAFTWKLNDTAKPSFSRDEVIHRMYTIEMWLDIDEFFLPRDEGRLQRCIEEVNAKRTEFLLWNR